MLIIAALICFEKPRRPLDSLFIGEAAIAHFNGQALPGRLAALSLESGVMDFQQELPVTAGDEIRIQAAGFPLLISRVESISKERKEQVSVQFKHRLDAEARDRLIVKLYAGDYSEYIRELDKPAIAIGLWKRAFGRLPWKFRRQRIPSAFAVLRCISNRMYSSAVLCWDYLPVPTMHS